MDNVLSKFRYSSTIMMISMLIFISLLTLVAMCYNYYRIQENYKEQDALEIKSVINKINALLDTTTPILYNIISEAEKTTCADHAQRLKQLALSTSEVKSLSVLNDNMLFCSSFLDSNHYKSYDFSDYYKDPTLTLLQSKFLKPQKSTVIYQVKKGQWLALAAFDGATFLKDILETKFAKNTYLIIHNNWLNSDDQIFFDKKIKGAQWLIFPSNKYPFKIALNNQAWPLDAQDIHSFMYIGMLSFILLVISLTYILLTAPRRDIQRGMLEGEFIPYYQLIISTIDQKWWGAEVLVRWQHPKKGLLLPVRFIELAETSKLIIPMTKLLIKKVATEISANIHCFPEHFYVSFNIHPSHLINHNLLDDCKQFLAYFPPDRIRMNLEFVEGKFIESSAPFFKCLEGLHQLGITIAIDDFGTGYSNLVYLQKYQIDHLKIDKSFVSAIDRSCTDTRLVDSIISLGKKMNICLIAEGVESSNQFFHLTQQGVDLIQGFLINRPSSLQEMLIIISRPIRS